MFKRISEKCSVIQCSSVSVFIHKGKGKDTKQDKDIGKDKDKNKDKLEDKDNKGEKIKDRADSHRLICTFYFM